tara:strand:+ start:734 stop:922 length:189 start_codon:yes stop_codon:yes gene_type:complete
MGFLFMWVSAGFCMLESGLLVSQEAYQSLFVYFYYFNSSFTDLSRRKKTIDKIILNLPPGWW